LSTWGAKMETKYQWNDTELGVAIEERDYQALEILIASGRNINLCEGFYKPVNRAFPPTYYNPLYYAVAKKDIKLTKFLLEKGMIIDEYNSFSHRLTLFYEKSEPEIFSCLCEEAYKRIMKGTTSVYPEMIAGLVEFFKITKKGFLYNSLTEAANINDTAGVKKILVEILKNKGKI